MEATGHYWQNLFAALAARGFAVALLNPLRTRRFSQSELDRAKTDAIDALGIARFAAQKRPPATPLSDEATLELRELVRLHDRLTQALGDQVRQLHRLVDLGFPELKRILSDLASQRATSILRLYPTAKAFLDVSVRKLSALRYDDRGHRVGDDLAQEILQAAKTSVGAHHGEAYRIQVLYACDHIELLRRQLRELDHRIEGTLARHEVGTLLTSIDGIGPHTAARLVAELGDPARFRDADALAAYVGVVPATSESGKRRPLRFGLASQGHARLRRALWMPTLTAARRNPWLRRHYERWRAAGKVPKVALTACMRKPLAAVYAVARDRRPFEPRAPGLAT
jgi:transposase